MIQVEIQKKENFNHLFSSLDYKIFCKIIIMYRIAL